MDILVRVLTACLALRAAVAQCPSQCWQPRACRPPTCGVHCCEHLRWRQQLGQEQPTGSAEGGALSLSRAERRRQRLINAQQLSTNVEDNALTEDDPITAALHQAVISASFHAPLLAPPAESGLDSCKDPGAFDAFDMVVVVCKAIRRRRVERLLRTLCLNATLIETPGSAPAAVRKRREWLNGSRISLSESEQRVITSMARAHQLFLASPARQLLVLEDTFVPSGPRLQARLTASLAALPSQWDLLFLGRCNDACDGEHLGGDLYRTFKPRCLHAHAATREGSFAFLEALESCPVVPCPADLAATSVAYVRGATFAISPSLFVQSPAGRMLDESDVHDTALVPSLDMSACALQYSACVRRGSCSDPRNVLRPHTFDGAPAWRSVQRWKPSDSLCPAALAQPRPTAAIQLQQTLTASLFAPAVLSGAQRAAQQRVGPLRFFEDASWPKAPSCISDPGAKQNDLSVRTIRVVRSSELNPNRTGWLYLRSRGVVFKPMIKVGSNFYRTYLMCLMPNEWEPIPESTKMLDARAVVIVRHPFSRFVSALGEVLARVFNRRCPWGQCNAPTDYYLVNGPWASIRSAATGTRWYSRAALVLASHARKYAMRNGSKGARGFDAADLRRLVGSFVHDTICNRHYYASEHFLTQTALMSQPLAPRSGMPTVPISTTVHAEDVQLAGSVDVTRLLAAFGIEATSTHRARAAQCYSQASAVGNVASSKKGIRALPRAAALLRVIDSDPSVQSLLCAVYYADFVCLGYDLPAICKSIFPDT